MTEASLGSLAGAVMTGVSGAGIIFIQASVMMPGLLPGVALLGVVALVVLLPLLALGVAAGVLFGPPLGLWLLVRRRHNRRGQNREGSLVVTKGERE